VLSFFAISVLDGPTEPDNPAATVGNIVNSDVLFRSGLVAFIIVLIADVVVAWALYVFFQRTSRELSLVAAWFRLLYVAIAAAALLNTLVVLKLVDGTGYSTALEKEQRDAQVMLSLDTYNYGFFLGLVSFGVHLLLLGFVMVKSDYAPSILGILVALAGLGYVMINLARVVLPNYRDYEDLLLLLLVVLALPGEFGLVGWLLWRGGKARPAN
jgi:small-conductance mechanosensitive channel